MNFNPFRRQPQPEAESTSIQAPAIMISGDEIITIVIDGNTHTVGHSHVNHTEILEAIKAQDWTSLPDLIDVPTAVSQYTEGNIVVNQFGEVTFNGVPIHNTVANRITQFFRQNLPFMPLVRFLENLMANPSRRAVEELYPFLENEGMAITEDGCFIGYKGVRDDFLDVHSKTFDNSPGQIHEMARNLVDDDARKACSNGFHIGSQRYATGWGPQVMLVKVNPADAVSVPYEDAEKLRVCKYEVLSVSTGVLKSPLFVEDDPIDTYEEEEEEEELCEWCGYDEDNCDCD